MDHLPVEDLKNCAVVNSLFCGESRKVLNDKAKIRLNKDTIGPYVQVLDKRDKNIKGSPIIYLDLYGLTSALSSQLVKGMELFGDRVQNISSLDLREYFKFNRI